VAALLLAAYGAPEAGPPVDSLFFFTSDNGPSLRNEVRGGNAGLLKCGKG
jgi:arylsulfatase A